MSWSLHEQPNDGIAHLILWNNLVYLNTSQREKRYRGNRSYALRVSDGIRIPLLIKEFSYLIERLFKKRWVELLGSAVNDTYLSVCHWRWVQMQSVLDILHQRRQKSYPDFKWIKILKMNRLIQEIERISLSWRISEFLDKPNKPSKVLNSQIVRL
jgi:hypothetical protein